MNANSTPPTYHERMQQIRTAVKDDPVVLALHDATVSPYTGRKWSDILYPRHAPLNPPPNQIIADTLHSPNTL